MSNSWRKQRGVAPLPAPRSFYQWWRQVYPVLQDLEQEGREVGAVLAQLGRSVRTWLRNLQRLWRWLPVIWADRDWDEAFLLEILERKLLAMAAYHRQHGITVDRERTARQLETAGLLARRLRQDDYCAAEHAAHAARYGELEWDPPLADPSGARRGRLLTRAGVTSAQLARQERAAFKRLMAKEERLKAADLELLTRLLRRHLPGWWD